MENKKVETLIRFLFRNEKDEKRQERISDLINHLKFRKDEKDEKRQERISYLADELEKMIDEELKSADAK